MLAAYFEWDAANRLTKISQDTNYVAFTYDGLSRRVQIVDVSGSTTNSEKRFLWCGTEMCEERGSGGGTIQKQFFKQGVRDNETNYFYCADHLGSIREVTDSSQAVVARYDYAPYGTRTKVTGSYESDLGFTGHYTLQPSWMSQEHVLTWFRIYRPDLGIWASREPFGEGYDYTLYSYVWNDPVNWIDPYGLQGTLTQPPPTTAPQSPPTGPQVPKGGGVAVVLLAVAGLVWDPWTQNLIRSTIANSGNDDLKTDPPPPKQDEECPPKPDPSGAGAHKKPPGKDRNPAQDKLLSPGDIKSLQNANINIHDLKGGKHTGSKDLYKDAQGNVYVKPKGGKGPGDPTGINLYSL